MRLENAFAEASSQDLDGRRSCDDSSAVWRFGHCDIGLEHIFRDLSLDDEAEVIHVIREGSVGKLKRSWP
ncbi:MAG: hypothetical protein ABIO86_19940 [Sphingomonas sp.]